VSPSKHPIDNCRQWPTDCSTGQIYSGPSGISRPHVDTPRSESQLGSLVVCLPSAFTGGILKVSHNGETVDFDWGSQSASRIQWAAFYSDCEHEITKVTAGHRITLTYNLYITDPVDPAGVLPSPIVEPASLPLYGQIKRLVDQPAFFPEGKLFWFCLQLRRACILC
jgi:hypothetical protein